MIDVKTEDGIALVTVSHGKANALDIELCQAIEQCFVELRAANVGAVVITGVGSIFSAGVDLVRFSAGGADYVRQLLPALHRAFEAVFFHPHPVVAAINGHAVAGGCILACCADRRIMARGNGRIGVTELLVGVPFPSLAFEILRAAVPPRNLAEFTYGGATYDAGAALQRGWIDETADAENLLREASGAAKKLAALPPAAFALTKTQFRQPVVERLERSRAAIDAAATEIWATAESVGHVRDYVARTLKKA